MRLNGKIAIVIGAGQSPGEGIGNGRATAIRFAQEGARVLCVDRDLASAQETVDLIEKQSGHAVAFEADVLREASLKAMVADAMRRWGRIDILHYNVGVSIAGGDAPPTEITEEAFDRVTAINLRGAVMACKHVLPIMREQKSGVIIQISSVASGSNYPYVAYKTSKAAMIAFTEQLAIQNAPYGVRANCILPGLMDTPMAVDTRARKTNRSRAEVAAERDSRVPLRAKMGTGWDVANAALFLASDEANFVTGVTLPVDGGALLNLVRSNEVTTVLTSTHWGVYEVEMENGRAKALRPFREDPDPSPIGLHMLSPEVARLRVRRPAVRKSWLEGGPGHRSELRGEEPFVEMSWDEAIDLVAREVDRVTKAHGNTAVFGGSYGWSSAGRFHHAQSQIHRFLNAVGGYVRHVDSYSLGAARVLLPHIVMSMDELFASHTSWDVMAENTKLFVTFGGVPHKNAQVSAGGPSEHRIRDGLRRLRASGTRFVNITPTADDLDTGGEDEWIAIRPNTDTAMLLAIAHVVYTEGLHDRDFLVRCCVGFERYAPYLTGEVDGIAKTPEWAASITSVPAERIASLARELAANRSMLNIAWSLQRSHHGEQPFWALIALACMLGQIGLPGGGFGTGYGAANLMGSPNTRIPGATLPQGDNAVKAFIPVARIADMLLNPGAPFEYNGATHTYPDIRLVMWAGGNPFHHHQDLNRLKQAWRKPETIVFNEQFWTPAAKMADIVLPVTVSLERDDIGSATRERHIIAMKAVKQPEGEARDDFEIYSAIAERLGAKERYTEGLGTMGWLRRLYGESRERSAKIGIELPAFDDFWAAGLATVPGTGERPVMLAKFREDPAKHPLKTPSGRIEIFSERIASFGYEDCPGHPVWMEPAEWLGSAQAGRYPLHMLSDQPTDKLHSQLDHSPHAAATKIKGRQPITISAADAKKRGIADGDLVRVFNDRGACLAAAKVSERIRPGVVRLSTGAWFDPAGGGANRPLEKHGNPNALTRDVGASKLSQGCTAQTCLVEVERYDGEAPAVTAHDLPRFVPRTPKAAAE